MSITHLDHVYAETHSWDASVAYWQGLGFELAEQWGDSGHRAGRLVAGSAAVVLAEVAADRTPEFNVFFGIQDAESFRPPAESVVTGLEDTHWGTRWIRVRDPEGRVYALEEVPE